LCYKYEDVVLSSDNDKREEEVDATRCGSITRKGPIGMTGCCASRSNKMRVFWILMVVGNLKIPRDEISFHTRVIVQRVVESKPEAPGASTVDMQ
jgi:hypothetical protein